MKQCIIILFISCFCIACREQPKNTGFSSVIDSAALAVGSDLKYAEGFTMSEWKGNKYIVVKNPWRKGDTLAAYLIVRNADTTGFPCRADVIVNRIPERLIVMSSAYLGMLKLLGEEKRVSACSNAKLIYDSLLYSRYKSGKLIDLGESLEMNAEAVVGSSPDLVMKYIYGSREMSDEKIIEAGIPVAYNLEFMEPHPLGRAEWIKFVAVFFGKELLADSIFREIEAEYTKLSARARQVVKKPDVLDGSSYKGVWYAAGGQSFPARLYADAGACYYWASDSTRGSIPLSFEVIIDKQADADFWIGPSSRSKTELLGIESRYSLFKAFRNGNVFHFSKRVNPNGGLDYFESGVVRPDILLADLIWVFHPDLLDSDYQPVYIGRIDE